MGTESDLGRRTIHNEELTGVLFPIGRNFGNMYGNGPSPKSVRPRWEECDVGACQE